MTGVSLWSVHPSAASACRYAPPLAQRRPGTGRAPRGCSIEATGSPRREELNIFRGTCRGWRPWPSASAAGAAGLTLAWVPPRDTEPPTPLEAVLFWTFCRRFIRVAAARFAMLLPTTALVGLSGHRRSRWRCRATLVLRRAEGPWGGEVAGLGGLLVGQLPSSRDNHSSGQFNSETWLWTHRRYDIWGEDVLIGSGPYVCSTSA